MVSVDEASRIVYSHLYKPKVVSVPLEKSVGRVLAEPIQADRDFPPFNRVAMDGIAIAFNQWTKGQRDFQIENIQAAGQPQKTLIDNEHCMEVMTGAMLPLGADCVIRYEDLSIENGIARVMLETLTAGLNIHSQRHDAAKHDVLITPGTLLSPAETALLASVGKSVVSVREMPSVALVSSGDELVAINAEPEPHQIRRSNIYAIEAAMREMQWPASKFHLSDDQQNLEIELKRIADQFDVMIISGGVSKGKFDYIPGVLATIGIQKLFHQVNQRPGKPFWFGVSDTGKVAFALPGNPVSTYMCFYKYIKPWILKSLGISCEPLYAMLATPFTFSPKLTYYLQVKVKNEAGKMIAYPQAGGGSGDFANLKDVSGFLELDAERNDFQAGDVMPYIPFR